MEERQYGIPTKARDLEPHDLTLSQIMTLTFLSFSLLSLSKPENECLPVAQSTEVTRHGSSAEHCHTYPTPLGITIPHPQASVHSPFRLCKAFGT
jgi:hypothetical protein